MEHLSFSGGYEEANFSVCGRAIAPPPRTTSDSKPPSIESINMIDRNAPNTQNILLSDPLG